MKVNKYFDIKELVSKQMYEQYGEEAKQFLDPKAIVALENVREILNVPLVCNNGSNGGSRTQSGYREPESNVGASGSAHKKGQAFDLISNKMSAKEMREKLLANEDKLIYPIRIEKGDNNGEISGLHIDVRVTKTNTPGGKIYFFKA